MNTTTTPASYSTREVCDIAGITYRQLDYWARMGLVVPSIDAARGSGSRRRFSNHDVAVVRVVAAVAGWVPLNRLGELVGFLTDLPLTEWPSTRFVLAMDGGVWLADDGAPKVGVHVDLSLIFDPVWA